MPRGSYCSGNCIRDGYRRHRQAPQLLAIGEHPKVVQERLGHGQIRVMLDTCSHVLPSMQRKAAEKAERLVLGTSGKR